MHAVILAGSRDVHQPLLAGTGLHSKALLPVGGRPMLLSVLETLAGSRHAPSLWVSTNDPAVLTLDTDVLYRIMPGRVTAVASIMGALERVPGDGPVLFVTADHPLLTSAMVDHFVDESLARGWDFSAAAVNRQLVQKHYPESRRTYFEARHGAWSGGNLFLVRKGAFRGSARFMERVDRNRKRPWRNLLHLDASAALRIALRQLTIQEVAAACSRSFGCRAGIVDMPFAECCMDVDKPSDQALADRILRRRWSAGGAKTGAGGASAGEIRSA